MYVLQAGFLDGGAASWSAALQGYCTFLKYARLWEWTRMERRGETVPLPAFEPDAAPAGSGRRA